MICITTHLHVCTCRPNVPSKTHLVRTQTILRAPATFHARHTAAHSASRGAALVQEEKPEKDWRIVQMIDACKAYYGKLWSKAGMCVALVWRTRVCIIHPAPNNPWFCTCTELDVASTLLDDQCVHKDMIWGGKELTVGPAAMTKLVKETRAAYPDLVFDVKQVRVVVFCCVFCVFRCVVFCCVFCVFRCVVLCVVFCVFFVSMACRQAQCSSLVHHKMCSAS